MFTSVNLIVTAIPFILAVPVTIVMMRKQRMKENVSEYRASVTKKYIFLYNNALTRKSFRHIVELYSSLTCFDIEQLQEASVKLFTSAVSKSLLIPIITLIVEHDPVLTGIAALTGFMYYQLTVSRACDAEIENMTLEASFTIQSISDSYSLVDDVTKAVKICERDKCLEHSITQIYEVLVAEDKEKAMYLYKKLVPLRILSSLMTTCYIATEEGDSRDENGMPRFVQKMTTLRLEADSKARNLRAIDIAFSSLANLSLTGIVVAPILEWFLLTNMPGTSVYLNGMYGSVAKTVLLLLTCLSYYVISALRRPSVVNVVDKSEFIDKLSKHRRVRSFVDRIIPRTYKAEREWTKRLNESLSAKDMRYIYTMKPLMAGFGIIIATVSLISFITLSKSRLWNNYGSLSAINYSTEMTEERYNKIKEVDYIYMTSEEKPEDDAARNLVKGRVSGLEDMEIEQQVDRLSTKWDRYYGIGFKWYYPIFIYLFGVLGWFTPEASIAIRKFLVKFEAAEDAMQLQSLMITLQSTKYDVRKCLYWMAQESTVHKAVFQYAYVEYGSDPELALTRLKDSVSLRDIKRLVAKLEKAMYDLSIEDAFRDISLDKQNSLAINEMLQNQQLEAKKEFARSLANAPLTIALYAEFVIPVLLLGYTQLVSSLSEMGVG